MISYKPISVFYKLFYSLKKQINGTFPIKNAKKIQIFKNLSIMILPPSPELNPIEQIWQLLRDLVGNRCYVWYEAIVDACCQAWNWLVDLP